MISPSSFAVFALKFLQKSMMFRPCGPSAVPTGGAGVALPAAIWSFTCACIFLAIFLSSLAGPHPRSLFAQLRSCSSRASRCLQFFYLQKVQLDRCCAAENRHHDLLRVAVGIHIVDHAV